MNKRKPWYLLWWMRLHNWRVTHIGTLETCYWCNRTFLCKPGGGFWTETGLEPLCSEECVHEYAKTL